MINFLVYFVSTIISSGVPFLLSLVLANLLPVADSGFIALYLAQVGLAVMVIGLGSYASVQARYFRDQARFGSYLSACLFLHVLGLIAILLALNFFGDAISVWASLPLWTLNIAALVAFMQCIINMHILLSQASGLVMRFFVIQLTQTLPLVIFAPLLAVVIELGWKGFVLAQVGQVLLGTVWSLSVLMRKFRLRFRFAACDLIANARFGIALVPHNLAGFIVVGYDRIYVGAHAGPEAAGLYSIMLQIGMLVSLLTTAINKIYTPWLYARLDDSSQWQKIATRTWIGVAVIFLVSIAFYPIVYLCIPSLLGSKFMVAPELIGWMILGGLFNAIYLLLTNMLFYSERVLFLSIASLVGALTKWLLMPIFFDLYGLEGVAASNVVGLVIIVLLVIIFVIKTYDQRLLFGSWAMLISSKRND